MASPGTLKTVTVDGQCVALMPGHLIKLHLDRHGFNGTLTPPLQVTRQSGRPRPRPTTTTYF